jgi:hypothetical protein
MSGGLVKKLMDPGQTLAALLEAPLSTGDFLKDRLAPKERRDIANNLLLAYEHVPPADRICFFDIGVTPGTHGELHQLHIEPQARSSTLQTGMVFKTAKMLKPIFYLPYRKNGTTRIKLAQPPGWGGGEVKFFATATIDGCSVYIEGPATAPKVTHANANAVQPTLATDTFLQKTVKINAKIAAMDTRLGHVKKGPAAVVERPDYMVEDPVLVQAAKLQFANWKNIPVAQVTAYSPFGAVVGVKNGTTWTFYMQKNGAFDHMPVGGAVADRSYMVLDAIEVYPNGGGMVRLLP